MIRRLPEVLAVIFFLVAIALAIRQQIVAEDSWFNLRQVWHHETLIAVFIFGGVCIILGKYLGKFKQ